MGAMAFRGKFGIIADMRMKYDLVVGFGPACSCSQTLRRAGLQLLSFPLDWLATAFKTPKWDNDVRNRAELVASRFEGWLRKEDFIYKGPHTNGKDKYWNQRIGMVFLHDFPQNVPLEDSFPEVAAKYKRRTSRLLDLIGKSRKVLVVRLDRPDLEYRTPDNDCRFARELLSKTFAPTKFDFLLLQRDGMVQAGNEDLEVIEPGLFRIKFDYADHRPGAEPMFPRLDLTAAAVSRFFAVREYRTKAEIAAHRDAERRKRWAKYGATNVWQYRWRKMLGHSRGISRT